MSHSSGVGDAYKHALDAFFDSRVSDAELVAAAETWPGRHSPKTKEEVYVRRVFDDVFGAGEAAHTAVPALWKEDRAGLGESR